jgi:hypothetical protein
MANGTTSARFRGSGAKAFRDPLRTRVHQDGLRLGVKIFLAPGEILAALFARAAVATGRFTSGRANEHAAGFLDLARLFRAHNRRDNKRANQRDSWQHAREISIGVSENATGFL